MVYFSVFYYCYRFAAECISHSGAFHVYNRKENLVVDSVTGYTPGIKRISFTEKEIGIDLTTDKPYKTAFNFINEQLKIYKSLCK